MPEKAKIKLSEIKFDQEIYPRKEHNPSKVQEYAENIEAIEAKENFLSIAKDGTLLDGRHRHLAYQKLHERDDPEITVYRYDAESLKDKAIISVELNNSHGQQLSMKDKENRVCWFYQNKIERDEEELSKRFSVTSRSIRGWLSSIKKSEKENLRELVKSLWMQVYTHEEIAEMTQMPRQTITDMLKELPNLENFPNSAKVLAEFHDETFETPIYNVWAWAKKTNEVSHFGNSEQRIVDNLLYLYTQPFDIVVDPFAGGGSTIDVCKKRLRRYWASDRKPIVERANEIRKMDIKDGVPSLNKNWGDVSLTYLDPPYWKMAENKYSEDADDLANMDYDKFNRTMIDYIGEIAKHQKKGVVALLIQPVGWLPPDYKFNDIIIEICFGLKGYKRLELINRVSCPYGTQQANEHMVHTAKESKRLIPLTRELIIWKVKNGNGDDKL